mmetsp:Transcript_54119/g.114983  ORF Transcript_54119/g.114983 Transcript_54119/m.114983 type:complete len:194 (-) Transcript_54119:356-937(-)|eukprot:CAMPEP_0172551656 /NCGR_PEP_ID=MMETSP1067-20121228/40124_1 /TAXON_ID=265564 ORGANISM="Thalassiosira punctigera, Strain Tpunct2005C2" /NCGR_SAMPLE_ID=MMETSP1067 /ASSEMBLY_ACC=CAM_ASM_000444 /LENGTH=193 /DNA_ID=CAMNT_0013339465 /DNA_START=141 /DNA_END=722 /DNA_ORIENTATION=-
MKPAIVLAFLCSCWSSLSALAYRASSSSRPALSRRRALHRTAAAGAAALSPFLSRRPPPAIAKTPAEEIELVRSTAETYRAVLGDRESFLTELAAEDSSAVKLPPQVPAIAFQKLAGKAHGVEGKSFDADDFPFLAVEYAESAGAARDYFKLAKLGRTGENGGAEVAMEYARQCVAKLEEASVTLETLREAIE